MRDGYAARWHGADYDVTPGVDGEVRLYTTAPADGFTEVRPGRFMRIVPDREVEDLRYVRTRCTWRGEPFIVIGEHGDWVRLEYAGGRAPIAQALGLETVDAGVYQIWASREEIEQLQEENI